MKQFYILGQRVNTYKFGLGTIVGFEDRRKELERITGHLTIEQLQSLPTIEAEQDD